MRDLAHTNISKADLQMLKKLFKSLRDSDKFRTEAYKIISKYIKDPDDIDSAIEKWILENKNYAAGSLEDMKLGETKILTAYSIKTEVLDKNPSKEMDIVVYKNNKSIGGIDGEYSGSYALPVALHKAGVLLRAYNADEVKLLCRRDGHVIAIISKK